MTFSVLGTDTQTGQRVELPQSSRREGLYIIGATGTGKSTLLENLILQDIDQQIGVCVLDPHGDLVNAVISRMKKRLDDVVLIDLGSEAYVTGLHLFHCEHPDDAFEAENVVQAVMHILEKVYHISRDTPLMNQYFINITRTLIYNPQATVLDIPRLLTDAAFRGSLLANVPDDDVQWFWTELYEQHRRGKRLDEIISAVTNKLVEFNSRVLKPWFGQNTQTVNIRQIMDERKILLVKLKARWQSMTSLIGSILIAQILDAAYSREDTRVNKRKQFNVYADEFQTFASQDFAQLFTEARKYGIGISISHQVFEQLDDTIKATIKQAANIIVFRVSSDNAKEIAGEFDCTPPPGEWIYEKQMRRAGRTYQVEYWEPQEAEEEYNALGRELAQVNFDELVMRTTFTWLRHGPLLDIPPDYKPVSWRHGEYTDQAKLYLDNWNFSLTTYKAVAQRNASVSLQKAANVLTQWFRPDDDDPQVYAYLSSFYEQEDIPLTYDRKQGYSLRFYDTRQKQYRDIER
jgi:Helicase HerA, central domain